MAVVGSVQIFMDVNTGRMSNFSRAASQVTRDGAAMRKSMAGVGSATSQAFLNAGRAAAAFNGHLGGLGAQMRGIGQLFQSVNASAALAGASIAGAGIGLTMFLQRADGMRRMENSLRTVTSGMSNLRDIQQELFEVSQRARTPMEGTVTLYARTARALEHLGTSQADVLRITETVQKAFAVGGASSQEAMGAAIQLSQGIASDRFSGEEYRSVSENAPVLLRAMADQLGVNIGKLRDMAHAGQLTGDVVAKAILGASKAIDEDFGKTVSTVEQSVVKLNNRFDQYVYAVDKTYGVTEKMAGAVNLLTDNFDSLGFAAGAALSAISAIGAGRLGASAIGKKAFTDKQGNQTAATGLQAVLSEGLFYGARRAAKAEADMHRSTLDAIAKERAAVADQITAIEEKSARRIADIETKRDAAIVDGVIRQREAQAKVNDLMNERERISGRLSKAQDVVLSKMIAEKAQIAETVKVAERQVRLRTLEVQRAQTFGREGPVKSLERETAALETARRRQAEIFQQISNAEKGSFNPAAVRKYGAEIKAINAELAKNFRAQLVAGQELLRAENAVNDARARGPQFIAAANAEKQRALRAIADLETRQYGLNNQYKVANAELQKSVRNVSSMSMALARLKGFGSGVWSMLGGGPGVAIMAAISAISYLVKAEADAVENSRALNEEMMSLGLLSKEAAEATASTAKSLESMKLDEVRVKIASLNSEIERMKTGQSILGRLFSYDETNLGNIRSQLSLMIGTFSKGVEEDVAVELLKVVDAIETGRGSASELLEVLNRVGKQDVSVPTLKLIQNLRIGVQRMEALNLFQGKLINQAVQLGGAEELKAAQAEVERTKAAVVSMFNDIVTHIAHTPKRRLGDQARGDLDKMLSDFISGKQTAEEFSQALNALAAKGPLFKNMADHMQPLLDALGVAVSRLKELNTSSSAADAPAWIQDLIWQDEVAKKESARQKNNLPFFSELEREANRSDWEKTVEDRAKKIMEAAEKANKSVTEIEARVAARLEMASEAAGKGLRDLIGFYEGTDKGRGYNETLGYGKFTGGDVNLTQMTLREVLDLQKRMLAHPDNNFNSSAVGRYQITSETLRDFASRLNLSLDTPFSKDVQDRLADEIIRSTGGDVEKLRGRWQGLDRASDSQIRRASSETFLDLDRVDGSVLKDIEALKNLKLEGSIGSLEEYNQKVIQVAQSLGATREEVEAYVAALESGNLEDIPKRFSEAMISADKEINNNLLQNLKNLQIEGSLVMLSDLDKELVQIAQSAGISGPELERVIAALKDGEYSNLPDVLRKTREEMEKIRDTEFMKETTRGFFTDLFNGIKDGEGVFESLANAAENALGRIADKLLNEVLDALFQVNGAAGQTGSIFGQILGLFGLGGGGGKFPVAPVGLGLESGVGLFHSGGDANRPRAFRSFTDSLPRFHKGIGHNELMAVLEKTESVLTKKQMGRTVGALESASSQMTSAYTDNRVFKIDARGAQQGVGEEIRRALIKYDQEVAPLTISRVTSDPYARG